MTGANVEAGTLGRVARLPLVAPLANRDFRLVRLGESVSLLGDQFNMVALAALVIGLTGSGFALGVIFVVTAIPRGAFMLPGGVSPIESRRATWPSRPSSSTATRPPCSWSPGSSSSVRPSSGSPAASPAGWRTPPIRRD